VRQTKGTQPLPACFLRALKPGWHAAGSLCAAVLCKRQACAARAPAASRARTMMADGGMRGAGLSHATG
jgi:hypothetical protein